MPTGLRNTACIGPEAGSPPPTAWKTGGRYPDSGLVCAARRLPTVPIATSTPSRRQNGPIRIDVPPAVESRVRRRETRAGNVEHRTAGSRPSALESLHSEQLIGPSWALKADVSAKASFPTHPARFYAVAARSGRWHRQIGRFVRRRGECGRTLQSFAGIRLTEHAAAGAARGRPTPWPDAGNCATPKRDDY